MSWRSIAGATYDIRSLDPVTGETVIVRTGIVAIDDTTFFLTPAVGSGLYYVALTAEPTK